VQGVKPTGKTLFDPHWQGTLSDYVTALAWSADSQILAASSAAGEVVLRTADALIPLQESSNRSVDCLAFSRDGQFLAAAGQDRRVRIWQQQTEKAANSTPFQLLHSLENAPSWVDRLAWSPADNQLAFSIGRYVQIWDASEGEVVTTLNFEASTVLGMSWRPDGTWLAIAGNQGVKVWDALAWDDDPFIVDMPAASVAIAWSPDGKYLASGNLGNTLTVLEWDNPHLPWVMRGFPGKVRNLTWSETATPGGASLLVASSVEGVIVWEKHLNQSVGWESWVLDSHAEVVQAIAFQPGTFLLASAADDGWVCLWQKAKQVAQVLEGAPNGFSCLAWHPQGEKLAAGGQNGELLIWSKTARGQGFRR
jgi:WD40 repeat protein